MVYTMVDHVYILESHDETTHAVFDMLEEALRGLDISANYRAHRMKVGDYF